MLTLNRWTQVCIREPPQRKVLFRCTCGVEKEVDFFDVKYGKSKSCGCLSVEITVKRNILNSTHGLTKSVEYNSWQNMKARVNYEGDPHYKDYGLRGITICKRWMNSFENFLKDMGNKPDKSFSLDRIDNNGNYEPSNCRWATSSQQNENKRKRKGSTSEFRGVFYRKSRKRYIASLKLKCGTSVHIGSFMDEQEAAKAYDAHVVKLGLSKPLNYNLEGIKIC